MNIRAKFLCNSVEKFSAGVNADKTPKFGEITKLHAVSGDVNKPWSEYTPTGRLEITITNQAALGAFEPGKAYYLDVSPVPEGE